MTPQEVLVELCERMAMMNGVTNVDATWNWMDDDTATVQVNVYYPPSRELHAVYTMTMKIEKEN